jgi:hypothetical protein
LFLWLVSLKRTCRRRNHSFYSVRTGLRSIKWKLTNGVEQFQEGREDKVNGTERTCALIDSFMFESSKCMRSHCILYALVFECLDSRLPAVMKSGPFKMVMLSRGDRLAVSLQSHSPYIQVSRSQIDVQIFRFRQDRLYWGILGCTEDAPMKQCASLYMQNESHRMNSCEF